MKYFLLFAILFTLAGKRNPLTIIKNVEFQWPLLILVSFGVQIILAVITIETENKFAFILVMTFLGIIVGFWKNRTIAGVKWIMTGALLNLTALIVHGGLMPVSEMALQRTGQIGVTFENDSRHQLMEGSMPFWLVSDWIPIVRYVLSPGDLVVGFGIILLIYKNSSKIGCLGERK